MVPFHYDHQEVQTPRRSAVYLDEGDDHEADCAVSLAIMTTAQALEDLTDPGQFEILATRSLRQLHPECKCIEHIGVNSQGKTIRGAIDAFARVPGSIPSKYVAAAFTLAARDELQRKWYSEGTSGRFAGHKPDPQLGDLTKACQSAAAIRKDEPESSFTVYLCTNQRLDQAVIEAGYEIGRKHAIEVIFVGQSRLRDFLDSPDGQPLREEFLGLRAKNVSVALVHQLARASVERYRLRGFLNDDFVQTSVSKEALKAMALGSSMIALVGRPGSGKSMIARSLLERHIDQGGIGLWIPGDFLQDALSLDDAVKQTVQQLDPYLGDEAGRATCTLASTERPLLLVVDDANRTDRPGMILTKVFGWGRNLAIENTTARTSIKLVVPVWESQFSNLRRDREDANWLHVQAVGPMERSEAVACLRNRLCASRPDLSGIELDYIAERLRDDPILLSIFSSLARRDKSIAIEMILDDVIGNFIDASLRHLATAKGTLKANYKVALAQLTRQMLVKRVLHPEWRDVREWLKPETVLALEQVAVHGDICRIANQGKRDIFEFRHDRILEHQLSETIACEFSSDEPDWDAVFDPYMVQATGRAIATNAVVDSVLDLAQSRLPTSLVAAMALLPPGASTVSTRICARVATWLGSISSEPPSVPDDALSILENARSEHVLAVTEKMVPTRQTLFARLRNGDATAGAVALSDDFYPSMQYTWLEDLIAQSASRHRKDLLSQLAVLLRSPSIPAHTVCGALTLAGYLADANLADAILEAWQSATDSKEVILPALWAALRCSDPAGSLLGTILPGIFSVSDKPGVGRWSDRDGLLQNLAFSARHGLSTETLTFLRNLAERDERYGSLVFSLFSRIDHRICLGFVVRRIARAAARPVESGHVSGVFMWENMWRRTGGFEYIPMPLDCVEALQEWWQPGNPDWLRSYAFKLWLRFSGDALWTVELPEDLSESDAAIWERAKRGDKRVTGLLLMRMADKSRWFQVIRHMWSDSFEPLLAAALRNSDSFAIEALRDAPNETAERLIVSNWSTIRDQPEAIAAALYVAKPSTIALACEVLSSDPEPTNRLRRAGKYFGFREHGYSEKLTLLHLETLRPFFHLLDDYDLADITEFCGSKYYGEWAKANLLGECRRRMEDGNHRLVAGALLRFFARDEELIAEFDRIATSTDDLHAHGAVWFWARRFTEQADDPERMPRLLNLWLGQDFSVKRFKFAAIALRYQGLRRSLGILLRFSCTSDWPVLEGYYRDAEYAIARRSLV